jgi:hypothetical protein
MSELDTLVDRYLANWNETDPGARRAAVEGVWAAEGRYVDPLADVSGPEAISELIGAVQRRLPGHVFRRRGGVDAHHDVLRFGWELVPAAGGESLAEGFDVATTNGDGRIVSVVGFLDRAPGA